MTITPLLTPTVLLVGSLLEFEGYIAEFFFFKCSKKFINYSVHFLFMFINLNNQLRLTYLYFSISRQMAKPDPKWVRFKSGLLSIHYRGKLKCEPFLRSTGTNSTCFWNLRANPTRLNPKNLAPNRVEPPKRVGFDRTTQEHYNHVVQFTKYLKRK